MTRASPRPPNVLLILSDQHRYDALGCYGNPIVRTPHLDRLVAQGVRFDAAYTPCPVCVPGRYAIYTGRYARALERTHYPIPDPRTGTWHEPRGGLAALSLRERTLGHLFRDRPSGGQAPGYVTGFVGKLHPVAPHTYGFDYYVDFGHYADYLGPRQALFARTMQAVDSGCGVPWIDSLHRSRGGPWDGVPAPAEDLPEEDHFESFVAREAIRFLRAYRDEPFCLVISFLKPHAPWVAAAPYRALYDPDTLPLPPEPDVPAADDPRLPAAVRQIGRSFWQPHTTWPLPPPGAPGRAAAQRRWLAAYYACVTQMDAAAGAVLDALEALGLAERTLIAYTADHGEMAGEHGLYQKFVFYEGAARVPLLIRPPAAGGSAPRPHVVTEPVDLTCLVPTFLDACGLAPPDPEGPHPLQGRSVAKLLRTSPPASPPPLHIVERGLGGEGAAFSEMTYAAGPAAMVRQGRWKLAEYATGERTLFDLAADPGETLNRAGDAAVAEVEAALRSRLSVWRSQADGASHRKPLATPPGG